MLRRFRLFPCLSFIAILTLSGCGKGPKTFDDRVIVKTEYHLQSSSTVNALAAADLAVEQQRAIYAFAVELAASIRENSQSTPTDWTPRATATAPTPPQVTVAAATPPPSTSSSIGEGVPCDGDLVPCWRVQIESKGTWGAYNPSGCGGSGCFGPYQFSGAWAGKLGLPTDLSTATEEQWVNAARELWASGSGCSNWDAC